MKNVLWVCDVPNWAYDVNAKALAANIHTFNHSHGYTGNKSRTELKHNIAAADIVVAMNPKSFECNIYNRFDNIITILDSVRALDEYGKNVLSKVAYIICCNKELYDTAKNINKNCVLQQNGVDLNKYRPCIKFDNQFAGRGFIIGMAANIKGNHGLYKGWPFYQDAAKALGDKIKQFNAVYGQNQIAPDRMVSDFYQKIDCLVLPSENEGCSNVIVEALACGLLVVCTKVGYHGHSLTNRVNCMFVERTGESIKQAILELITNGSMRKNMIIEARKFAENNHDIKRVSNVYENIFKFIAG